MNGNSSLKSEKVSENAELCTGEVAGGEGCAGRGGPKDQRMTVRCVEASPPGGGCVLLSADSGITEGSNEAFRHHQQTHKVTSSDISSILLVLCLVRKMLHSRSYLIFFFTNTKCKSLVTLVYKRGKIENKILKFITNTHIDHVQTQ